MIDMPLKEFATKKVRYTMALVGVSGKADWDDCSLAIRVSLDDRPPFNVHLEEVDACEVIFRHIKARPIVQ